MTTHADLIDDEGENRALRSFLMMYGGTTGAVVVKFMRRHMEMSGWGNCWPEWVNNVHDGEMLTKAGAQLWIRHLLSMEPAITESPQNNGEWTGDPEKDWAEFWSDICAPGGELDIEQVKRELSDYRMMLGEVGKVYEHVTGGMITKQNTTASAVISLADEKQQERFKEWQEDEAEAADEAPITVPDGYQIIPTSLTPEMESAMSEEMRRGGGSLHSLLAAILISAPKPEVWDSFQTRVNPWMMECFGEVISGDRKERNHRFLEEALELVQACGCTASEAHQLVGYVFGRPVGEREQEVGGVMVTLAALCLANNLDMHKAGEIELARIWTKVEQIRAKQAAKPKHSPLPEARSLQQVNGELPLLPEPSPQEQKLSERVNWNTRKWYEHVGAWEKENDQIVFGSVMAVRAMLVQFQAVTLYAVEQRATYQPTPDEQSACEQAYDARYIGGHRGAGFIGYRTGFMDRAALARRSASDIEERRG